MDFPAQITCAGKFAKAEEEMHIFLIRHGESVANIGDNYMKRIPDHLVSLTERGKE